MSDRFIVAKELAEKDGAGWDKLSQVMRNAYLHNADLVIQERNPTPVESDTGKPIYTCDRCKDKAYLGDKPCLECNPRGLPVEEVHPKGELILVSPDEFIKQHPLKKPEAKERQPKPGEYYCARCNTPHRKTSKIGKKHLGFKQ